LLDHNDFLEKENHKLSMETDELDNMVVFLQERLSTNNKAMHDGTGVLMTSGTLDDELSKFN
jgi:hypothetical protein